MIKEKSLSKKSKYKFNNFNLIFGCIFVLSFCAVTFAKYISTIPEKQSSVTVAKWEVSAGDMEKSFNLFSSSGIYELPQGVTDLSQLSEDEIKVDEDIAKGKKIIAPGTWGKIDIDITNDSDVAVQYDFSFTNIETKLPICLSIDGKNWNEVSNINNSILKSEILDLDESTKTITLYWRWDYTTDSTQDEKDTEMALDGETCKVSAKVTFTQAAK